MTSRSKVSKVMQRLAQTDLPIPADERDDTGTALCTPLPPDLNYVDDCQAGLSRRKLRGKWAYFTPDGERICDQAEVERINKLAIPPAYTDVWICPDANGHLQATGRDARGRKQYRYHPDWQAQRGEVKFESLRAFAAALPRIRARVKRDLDAPAATRPTRTLVLATLVRLLDTTFVRIGNEEYVRGNGSYGLTTLRTRHAGVRDAEVRLSFKGKSGVRHEVRLDDRRVAAVVRRCKALPGQELFQYVAEDGVVRRISSSDVNDYLAQIAGLRVTAKDFRTWHGSVLALEFTRLAAQRGHDRGSAKQVIAQVAARLRNTVAVCRKSYIHPAVLALGPALASADLCAELLAQRWCAAGAKAARGRSLSAAERRLVALLGAAAPARSRVRPPAGRRTRPLPQGASASARAGTARDVDRTPPRPPGRGSGSGLASGCARG